MADADARARIAVQADDATRRSVADVVVVNDGDLTRLHVDAARILEQVTVDPRLDGEARR